MQRSVWLRSHHLLPGLFFTHRTIDAKRVTREGRRLTVPQRKEDTKTRMALSAGARWADRDKRGKNAN